MASLSESADSGEAQSTAPALDKPLSAYPPAAEVPTQEGPNGVRFDFNDGCRVLLPQAEHPWRVRLSDLDTGNILYETEISAGRVNSAKHYYFRACIEVLQRGERILCQDYSAKD